MRAKLTLTRPRYTLEADLRADPNDYSATVFLLIATPADGIDFSDWVQWPDGVRAPGSRTDDAVPDLIFSEPAQLRRAIEKLDLACFRAVQLAHDVAAAAQSELAALADERMYCDLAKVPHNG